MLSKIAIAGAVFSSTEVSAANKVKLQKKGPDVMNDMEYTL